MVAVGVGVGVFLGRLALRPHSGTQRDTGGNGGCDDEFLHYFSSLHMKRVPDLIALRQETERSFSC